MPDTRQHRGRHPADTALFAPDARPALIRATGELSWLLDRGYSQNAALKLVGDRHALRERQRLAVLRCACGDTARGDRAARRQSVPDMAGRRVALDGFNCIITLEAALSGGAVLLGRDRVHRDLSSVHGTYRKVAETERAVRAIAGLLVTGAPAEVTWLLDRPVSNSGRLKRVIELVGDASPSPWRVELCDNPDRALSADPDWIVCSSDSWILDSCGPWLDVPGAAIGGAHTDIPDAWIVDLSGAEATP